MQLTAQDEPGSQAGADREKEEIVHAARHASPLLAEGSEVDVVLELNGQAERVREPTGEPRSFDAEGVRGERDRPVDRIDHTGNPDDRTVEACAHARVDELPAE